MLVIAVPETSDRLGEYIVPSDSATESSTQRTLARIEDRRIFAI